MSSSADYRSSVPAWALLAALGFGMAIGAAMELLIVRLP